MVTKLKQKNSHINLILPKDFIDIDFKTAPRVYFLAGPIRGADDWQREAINLLSAKDKECYIVCPRRYDSLHELYNCALNRRLSRKKSKVFHNQTMWERYYLEIASFYGAIIFWLPAESIKNPRLQTDGPYARDTMGELGRWSIRSAHGVGLLMKSGVRTKKINISLGIASDFSGEKVIRRNIEADHGRRYRISRSLESTVLFAIRLAKKISG